MHIMWVIGIASFGSYNEYLQDITGLDKSGYQVNIFLISPRKTYVVGTH